MNDHINTFEKGVNNDSAPQYQPLGTIRSGKNWMITSYDNNHWAIEDKLSNRALVEINTRYKTNENTKDIVPIPIGWFSAIEENKIVVHSTSDETNAGGYGEIGIITFGYFENKLTADYLPIYHHVDLKYSKQHMIGNEGFYYHENDIIGRNYYTDNSNDPRVIDTLNPIYTTYFASGSLVSGKEYMVLEGVIEHPVASTVKYGPGMPNGNVFTASSTTYTATTGTTPVPLVIAYYPINLLNWIPDRSLGNIFFYEYGSGSVICGNKQYFYQQGKKSDGYFTPWSYGSFPVHVGTANSIVVAGEPFHNFVGKGSTSTLDDSGKSVKMKITNIDTAFDTLRVACAEYDQSTSVFRQITVIAEETITGSTMTIEHTGDQNLGDITFDELVTFPTWIQQCKTLTTAKNYNIPGNLKERPEIDLIDKTTITATSFEYPLPVHGDEYDCNNAFVYGGIAPTVGVNPAGLRPWERYVVTSVAGGNITYNAVSYGLGDVITGIAGVSVITIPAGSQCRPCVNRNKYTTTAGAKRPNALELRTAFWTYKDPTTAHHCKGNWSREMYRYAIISVDKKGNPFFAQHAIDYTMPSVNSKNGLMRADLNGTTGTYTWALNPSGVKLSGIRFTKAMTDNMSGFMIVRAPRDGKIITQGLALQVSQHGAGPTILTPLGSILASQDAYAMSIDAYTYICPDELCFLNMPEFDGNDAFLEEVSWLEPVLYSGTYRLRAGGPANEDVYSKLFIHKNDGSGAIRTAAIHKFHKINEGDTITDFDGSGNDFYNYDLGVGGVGAILDNTCMGGGSNDLNNRRAVGGKKVGFMADGIAHFGQYPAGYGYTGSGGFDATNPYKILMNYIKANPNPYGGSSEAALANTKYISTGHFQEITSAILAEVETAPGSKIYEFNDVEIFGGDCFVNLVDYGYALNDTGAYPGNTYSMGFYFPCESNSNYDLRRGRKISNSGMGVGTAGNGVSYSGTRFEDYSYNPGYGADGLPFKYPARPVNLKKVGRHSFRARFAGQKIPGELTDSYRVFPTDDYKDADGALGEINNVRGDGDVVIYWQHGGLGVYPVLQREVQSGSTGQETNIGTGGVLDRFDTKSNYWGNQHTHGLVNTEYGYAWFDMRRRALLAFIGGAIKEVSMECGHQVFFNNNFIQNNLEDPTQELIYSTDKPLMGNGIIGVYDPKFKLTYLTFKFYYQDNSIGPNVSKVSKDFTIAYDHIYSRILPLFDFKPATYIQHNNIVLSANNAKNETKYYGTGMLSTTFGIGDTVNVSGKEYVCYAPVTIASYPGSGTQLPTAVSSAYWKLINKQCEIYVENEVPIIGSKSYCQFYGKTWDQELEIVINPQSRLPFSVDTISRLSNDINFTSVQYDTTDQQIIENIKAWDRNYEYKRRQWDHNVPFASNGRLEDFFLKAKFVKKNYDTDPTVPLNKQMIIRMIISKARERE